MSVGREAGNNETTAIAQQILLRASRLGIGCNWLRKGPPRKEGEIEGSGGRWKEERSKGERASL